jgi:hypothetical protein
MKRESAAQMKMVFCCCREITRGRRKWEEPELLVVGALAVRCPIIIIHPNLCSKLIFPYLLVVVVVSLFVLFVLFSCQKVSSVVEVIDLTSVGFIDISLSSWMRRIVGLLLVGGISTKTLFSK